MADNRSILSTLPRIYFWGWVLLTPLIILAGLIGYVSFNREFEYFVEGLWIGALNLGILWTAAFLLISVIQVLRQALKPKHRQSEKVAKSFWNTFLSMYPMGLTVLVVSGFVSEFLAHSFSMRGSLLTTVVFGFLPMTIAIAAIALVKNRGRSNIHQDRTESD